MDASKSHSIEELCCILYGLGENVQEVQLAIEGEWLLQRAAIGQYESASIGFEGLNKELETKMKKGKGNNDTSGETN